MPRITLMLGSVSRAWIMRPPQNVSDPVTRTRRLMAASAEPDAAPVAQHVVHRLLEERADVLGLLHDPALRVPVLIRGNVEVDGIEHPQFELGRERRDHTERPEGEHVGRDGEIGETESAATVGSRSTTGIA